MDGTLVYSKTPRGIAEISLRSAQLPMTTRRVLIMIDGKRSVDDLAILLKPGEIDNVIATLENAGFIQRVTSLSALDVPTINGRDMESGLTSALSTTTAGGLDDREPNSITLEDVKKRAVRGLTDRMGPEAESLAIRIENCRSIEEFRYCVREAERFISLALGQAAAQEYLKSLRRRA